MQPVAPVGPRVFYWAAPVHRRRGIARRGLLLVTKWALNALAEARVGEGFLVLRATSEESVLVARAAGNSPWGSEGNLPLFTFPKQY